MTHFDHPARLRRSTARAPLMMALEPRFMFDGAVATDATKDVQADAAAKAAAAAAAAAVPAPAERKEVAFVDTSVADWQTLVADVPAGVEVVLIQPGQGGLAQMAQWAETHSGYDAIHILSHGSEATLRVGGDTLSAATLADAGVRAELASLGAALKADGDLLVYGCSVAAGEAGRAFVTGLAEATGADVAASDDATGAAALGGDWTLETTVGTVSADAMPAAAFADYHSVLVDQTFDLDTGVTFDATAKTATQTLNGFTLRATGTLSQVYPHDLASGVLTILPGGAGNCLYFGWDQKETAATFDLTGGNAFDLTGFYIFHENDANPLSFTLSAGGVDKTIVVNTTSTNAGNNFIDVSAFAEAASFTNITSFTLTGSAVAFFLC